MDDLDDIMENEIKEKEYRNVLQKETYCYRSNANN